MVDTRRCSRVRRSNIGRTATNGQAEGTLMKSNEQYRIPTADAFGLTPSGSGSI